MIPKSGYRFSDKIMLKNKMEPISGPTTKDRVPSMALLEVVRGMRPGYVPHGFRSTFSDWCSERTAFSTEVREMALAHAVGDKVEAAYRRGDLFEKRRQLAEAWAKFCSTPAPADRGEIVVAIGAAR